MNTNCLSHAMCREPGCAHVAKASSKGDWLYCKGHQRVHGMRPRDYVPEERLKRASRYIMPKEPDADPLDIISADWHTPEPLRAPMAAESRAAT